MKLHSRVASLLVLFLTILVAPAARATSLTLDLAAYSLHATDARLIGRITNVSGASSGTISLRLYATAAPYDGSATSGYLMGQITPGALSPGAYFPVDNLVPLTVPPNGDYYASLLVVETIQTQDFLRAYYRWTSPISFGALRFNGTAGWQSSGNSVRLYSADGITNYSSGGRSTSYRVELWTFATPYTGVAQPGASALRASYNFTTPLNALATLSSFDQTVPLTVPAPGSYYTALLLADMSSGSPLYTNSYIVFPNQWVVTSPGATVATPTIAPNGGTFSGSVQVSLACDTAGASIYYTDNGATPGGAGSMLYSGPFTLNASKTIKAIAIKSGSTNSSVAAAAFVINAPAAVAAPSVSPVGGNFTSPQTVTLSTTTAGADIYYTTNGDTPSAAATLYTVPFPLSASATVKAKAVKSGFTDSAVTTAAFTIVLPTMATPVISPAGGTFTLPPNVTISCATFGAQIFYGLNGELPETPYPASGGVTITSNTTLTAIAKKSGSADSIIASASFTISAKTIAPAFSPPAGSYAGGVTVTLSSLTGGAQIRYTTDGNTPTASSTLYSAPFTLNSTTTVKAMAMKAGFNNSDVLSATYAITPAGTVATPHIAPGGGFYYGPVRVSLTTTTAGANIYYTTDGVTVPTEANGTLYTGPFWVYVATTLKVRAFKAGSNPSAIVTNSPITISNANNIRADSAWEVTEYRFSGSGTVTTLAQAETMVANPNAAGLIQQRYQSDVINRFDPDSPSSGGFFTGDLPFAVNNLTSHGLNGLNNGDDDNFILSARCAFLVFEAGDYTFGFSSDDGARLRITGAVFTGSLRLNTNNPNNPAHNGDTLSFPVGTGNSDTLGYCNLSPGLYFLDFLTWENAGGAYAEVFAARGIKTSLDNTFRLVGHDPGGMAGNGITIPAPGWQVTQLKEGATNFNAALGRMYDWWTRKSVVTGIRFTSADDFPERDPMTFVVEGSTGHAGNGPWTVIASGNTQVPTTRGTGGPRINISNTTAWKAYRVTFPTIRTPASANSMQIAEVEFYDADGLGMDLANGKTAYSAAIPSSNNSPQSQGAEKVLDGLTGTKYLNFDRFSTGFTLLPAAQIFSYLNLTDPDAGSGLHGHISFPFPGDGIGDDNNFVVGARARMNVPTAGDYTFCVLADDGIRLRIKGSRGWRVSSPNAAQTLPQTLSDGFQANGWGADVFGSVQLDAGSYEVEVIYDEIAGGAYMGVYSAWGRHTAWSSVAFTPLSTINGSSVEDDAPVYLRGPVSYQPPTNDDFDTALAIDGPVVHTTGNNTGAIMQTDEPVQHGMTGSIWWSWLAPAAGSYIVDTVGSEFNSALAVYTNATLSTLVLTATDATRGGNGAAKLTLNAAAGTMYRIQVGTEGPGATGRVRLNIRPVPAPPANDNFAAAMNLGSNPAVSVNGTTDGASFQSGEPIVSGGWSVWHHWTAPYTGDFIINTAGSDFDTTLGVFTGTAHNALTLVAFNNNESIAASRTSSLRFSAKAGTVYRISVDGQAPPSSGNYVLNILPVPDFTGIGMTGSGANRRFNLNWRSEPWQTYRIQKSDNLSSWGDVESCFGTTNTSASTSVAVPDAATTRQFFRILRE